MSRIVYTFDAHRLTATKSGPCSVCGRKARRQRTFEMTLNPWNKNPDGTVRTVREIYKALSVQAEAWKAKPATHPRCEASS